MEFKWWHNLKKKVHEHLDKEFHKPYREEAIRIHAVQGETCKFGAFINIPLDEFSFDEDHRGEMMNWANRQAIEQLWEQMLNDGAVRVHIYDDPIDLCRHYRYSIECIKYKE